MKVRFDEKADTVFHRLNAVQTIDLEKVSPVIILDFYKHDQMVDIELVNMKKRVSLV